MGLLERLANGEILIGDGATGTYLQGKGLEVGDAPEAWNFSHADIIRGMAADYAAAGSDLVETNSFGGNRFRLEREGLADRAAEVNRTAAQLARAGAGDRLVMGSIGPTGDFMKPLGLHEPEAFYEAFREQAEALASGGVDGFCVETMTAIEEAEQAIRAAKSVGGLPVVATMTFDPGARGFATSMGVTIEQAVKGLLDVGADVIGTNCGNGSEQMIEIVRAMRAITDAPILVQANAGLPVMVDGLVTYPETPDEMAERCRIMREAGANIIGGCCGTGPDHMRAIAEAVRRL